MKDRLVLARHPVALTGIVLVTVSAAVFVALAVAQATGLLRSNPYAGLVVFVALPALILVGLLLIPVGMRLQRRRIKWGLAGESDWPIIDLGIVRVRRMVLTLIALTAVNLAIFLLAGYGALHWMESPQFCGQTCHTPMHPQFSAWTVSSHAQVACVTCHIGEGADAFVHAKLAGVRQLWHVTTNSYPRPVPAVAAGMPAAVEVCGRCHVSTKDHGVLTRVIRDFGDDEANTESATTLQMHVGGPGRPTSSGRAIHWHADPRVRVEFVAADADRQTIPYVKVTDAGGKVREFTVEGATKEQLSGERRVMDCVDCHNSVGHRVWAAADDAVDAAIANGVLDRGARFIRREGVKLMTASYPSEAAASAAVDKHLRAFYAGGEGGTLDSAALGRAVEALRAVYRHNVFPDMKVTWGTYPNNIGHMTSSGCFRCHDDRKASDGSVISADCEYCHVQAE